ncbi:U4/U6.U5 small nuclear ribonucleoprotein 27 kDa protein [Ditylenchus destructor]|uniref:U4/U6.U5 small nuclear ribonucleoprotein 27 kDa protein n=1 Tax=Ditylenchus destructor TaxID=166010 RepID=A0AAD4R766_9BILA|nr:U4/U6.U5 small nuclear ribonucleoprotein 27 kDa protein [Ditylenchus destructor]
MISRSPSKTPEQISRSSGPARRSRSRSPLEKRRSRSPRDKRDRDRRRSRTPDDSKRLELKDGGGTTLGRRSSGSPTPSKSSSRRKDRKRHAPKIDLESCENVDEEMSKLMGFAGFDTTKNKKVPGNVDGVSKINKPRKYRQYMNRKGGFNRPLDYVAKAIVIKMEIDLGTNVNAPNNMLPFMATMASNLGNESSEFIGRLISIRSTDGSYYQGLVQSVDFHKSITLVKPFRDGVPLNATVLTILASSILDLKIVQRNTTGHRSCHAPEQVTSTPKCEPVQQSGMGMNAPTKFVKEHWDKVSCQVQPTEISNLQKKTANVSSVSEIIEQAQSEVDKLSHISDERKENEQMPTLEEDSKKRQGSSSETTAAIDGVRISLGELFMTKPATEAPKIDQETVKAIQGPLTFDEALKLPKTPMAPRKSHQEKMNELMKQNRYGSPQIYRPPPNQISMRQLSSPQITSQHVLSNQMASRPIASQGHQIPTQYIGSHPVMNHQMQGQYMIGPQNWPGNFAMTHGNYHPRNNAHSHHSKFGEFRHFREQQVAMPRVLKVNRSGNFREPSGIPTLDCANGYSSQQRNAEGLEFDQPIDFNELNTDFDFESNLALFDKTQFPVQEAEVGQEVDPNALIIPKRNFRNDENVLSDPAKVISWTQQNTKRAELEEAVKEFCGCLISIEGEDGSYYQGKVIRVDPFQKAIILEKPFKDGLPIKEQTLTMDAPAMRDLKIVRMGDYKEPEPPRTLPSTSNNGNKIGVAIIRNKPKQVNEAKKQPKRIQTVVRSVKTVNRSQNNTQATPEKNRNSHEAGNKKNTQPSKSYGAPPLPAYGTPPPPMPRTPDGVRITVNDLFLPKAPKAQMARPHSERSRTLIPSHKKNAVQKNQHTPQPISHKPLA